MWLRGSGVQGFYLVGGTREASRKWTRSDTEFPRCFTEKDIQKKGRDRMVDSKNGVRELADPAAALVTRTG
jgi:hypothetical protein